MPPEIDRTGKVEMLLSESQIRDIIAWADVTPGWRGWKTLQAKLEDMGVAAAFGAVMKFLEDRIKPGLDRLGMIADASRFAQQVGEALGTESTDSITRAANLMQQEAAFEWALKHKRQGTFDLDNPEFLETFVEVSKATRSGLVAVDRKAITDARVQTLELKLKESEEKREAQQREKEAASAKLQELRNPDVMNSEKLRQAAIEAVDEALGFRKPKVA